MVVNLKKYANNAIKSCTNTKSYGACADCIEREMRNIVETIRKNIFEELRNVSEKILDKELWE